ncbi:MAG: DNA-directed RNA polymerase subunit omega [bacterium]
MGGRDLNKQLLKAARLKIPNVPVLVNTVSQRIKQLYTGHRPYLKPFPGEEAEDIALREIAEGKLTVEIDFSAVAEKAKREKAVQSQG